MSEEALTAFVSDITSDKAERVRAIAKEFGTWKDCFALPVEFDGGEWGILVADKPDKAAGLLSALDSFWAGWEQGEAHRDTP